MIPILFLNAFYTRQFYVQELHLELALKCFQYHILVISRFISFAVLNLGNSKIEQGHTLKFAANNNEEATLIERFQNRKKNLMQIYINCNID